MPDQFTITLALQEGFYDDHVVIAAAGEPLERLEHLTTLNQIGLAKEVTLTVPAGARLSVALPDAGVEQAVEATADGLHYGISFDRQAGHLVVRRSTTPFGYA